MAFAVIFLFLAASTLLAAFDLRRALLFSVFLLPFTGLDVDVGLRITLYQVAMLGVVLVCLLRLTQPGFAPPPLAAGWLFAAFLVWAVIWSLLQLGYIPQPKVGDGVLRGPTARAIIQIMLFIFAISPVVVTPMAINRIDDFRRMAHSFMLGVIILMVIGWLQLAVWYATGTNPIPIEAFNGWLGGRNAGELSGAFGFDALNIYRMNSFAGEPRELGSAITLGLLLVQCHALVARHPGGWRLFGLWLALFLTLLATFSTSGLLLWGAASFTLLPACWLFRIPVERSPAQLFGAFAAILLPGLLVITVIQQSGFDIIGLLAERTIERLGSDGAIEDFDLAILDYLSAHPAVLPGGTGLGNAHLYAMPYLDPLFALYAEGNVFVAKSLYLKMISEIGLIGFSLFLVWYGWLALQTRLSLVMPTPVAAIIPMAGAMLTVNFGTVLVGAMTFALAGAMTALCAVNRHNEAGAAVPA
jgi:hypothetical protein